MSVLTGRTTRIAGHRRCARPAESRRRARGSSGGRPGWRSLFRIGPGLVLAIIAIVLVWTRMPRQPGPPPGSPLGSPPGGGPAQVQRTELAPASPSAPDPAWLLDQSRALELSPAQTAKLTALKARWDRETGDLRAELAGAEADFQRRMREDAGAPVSMPELQERAAPVSEMARQLGAARKAWWAEASTVLTESQRARAETMWAGRFQSGAEAGKDR